MKQLEAPVKISYTNPIKKHYEENTKQSNIKTEGYENGMFISINNKRYYDTDLRNKHYFRDVYISIIKAVKGKEYKISKTDVKQHQGEWNGDRIELPTRQNLLSLIDKRIPILICGIHNYKKDDIRSKGKEYCHSHYYLYNIHHHIPNTPIELRNMEGKIEGHLVRHIGNKGKRFQGVIDIEKVKDNVSPTQLYDYLQSPINNPQELNLINYMANNRHLPSIQYPLTTIYSYKKL